MTDVAASLGLAQLNRTAEMHERRQWLANRYTSNLVRYPVGLPDVHLPSAWHLYPIQVGERDAFVRSMGLQGVQCSVHFIPLHHHTQWQRITGKKPGDLPYADRMFSGEVSLPLFSKMAPEDVGRVCAAVREALFEGMAHARGNQ
jgi:dTDP-4-amino-4,6-dideoxygalactose transaminase